MKLRISQTLQRWRDGGSGLAAVLVITAIMVILAFTVVGLSFNHLNATTRMSNAVYAKDLAEAAIASAIDQVLTDSNTSAPFGVLPASATLTCVNLTLPGAPDGSYGALTFDPAIASTWSANVGFVTWYPSLNNLANQTSVPDPANTTIVPSQGLFLSAVGVCNGMYRRVETVIYVPQFPYVAAASGPINCGSNTYLAAVNAGGSVSNPADLMPANLASNFAQPLGNGVTFYGSNITLVGDLQSSCGANLTATDVNITGQKRLFANAIGLPSLTVSNYDTASQSGVQLLSSTQSSSALSGYCRRQGDLLAPNGLNLNSTVLFVNGNLNVAGGINGTGAVIVNGSTANIGGTSAFSGSNKIALVAQGTINLQGESGNPSQMSGLIYSGTAINASYVQMRGPVVANDPTGTSGQLSISQSNVTQDTSMGNFNITVGSNPSTNAGNVGWGGGPSFTAFVGTADAYPGNYPPTGNYTSATTAPALAVYNMTSLAGWIPCLANQNILVNVSAVLDPAVASNPIRFWDSNSNQFVAPVQLTQNAVAPSGNPFDVTTPPTTVIVNATTGDYQVYTGNVTPLSATDFQIVVGPTSLPPNPSPATVFNSTDNWQPYATQAYVDAFNTTVFNLRGAPGLNTTTETPVATAFGQSQTATDVWLPVAATKVSVAIALANQAAQTLHVNVTFTNSTNTTSSVWALNLNNDGMIPLGQKIRVLWWRDVP